MEIVKEMISHSSQRGYCPITHISGFTCNIFRRHNSYSTHNNLLSDWRMSLRVYFKGKSRLTSHLSYGCCPRVNTRRSI